MNTPTTSNKFARMATRILVSLMFSFSFLATAAQAVTVESTFDHSKTGFVLREVHATLKCEQCHVDGIFKNTPKDCAGCHNTGTRVAALPKPINHIATTFSCDTCHISAASFLIKSFSHVTITGQCETCHNGQSLGVVSKPVNHFPTQQPCGSCHTNTSSFLSWRMDHTGITSNCFACHGGPAGEPGPIGSYPNVVSYNASIHVPITNAIFTTPPDCFSCHTNYSSFLGAAYSHIGVTSGTCGTCHKGQYPNVVSINAATHIGGIPAAACDTCHFGYASFLGAKYTHTAGSICSTCHQGQYSGVISINLSVHIPLPSGSTCVSCHVDPTTQSLSSFLGVTFHKTAIGSSPTGACATCHNGGYASQNASGKSITHIPTTADCGSCHTNTTTVSYTTFLNVKFHQTPIGNPLPIGMCSTCHNGGYLASGAQAKNIGHVATSSDCVVCHTGPSGTNNTAGFTTFLGASFSHSPGAYVSFPSAAPASPTCSSCHNGATATGKVASHVPTTGDCISCHTNATTGCPNCLSFYGVVYSHTNATIGVAPYGSTFPALGSAPTPTCSSCHNGTTALGKNTGHVATTLDCITCHGCPSGNCTTFLGATFSHTGIATGTCGTCHMGQYTGVVSINTSIHIPQSSGNACDLCHTNAITGLPAAAAPTFLNVVFHANALGNPPTGTCTACHNGSYISQNVQGKSTGHVVTTADCVSCHTSTNTSNYTTFLGAGYSHSPGTYPAWPPASPSTPTCASCHNGVAATGTNSGHPAVTSDCLSCHGPVLVGCPSCSSFGIPAGVIHNTAPYNTPNTCITCHNGTTAIGLSSDTGHIPIGSAGCDQCHPVYDGTSSINFSTAAVTTIGGTSPRYAMKHSAVTGRCDSCHNGSYTGQGLFGAVTKVSNHIPTTIISTSANTDCTSCHSTTINVTSGAPDWATGERMNHNNAQGGAPNYCVTCHLKGVTYLSKAQLISHNGASTSKDCSSSSCHKPLGKKGSAYSSWD
jgi:hypothetical protein